MMVAAAAEHAEQEQPGSNPLLDSSALPRYAEIRPEHIAPAVDALIAQADAALERAVAPQTPPEYDALSATLDVATERLDHAWGTVNHLNAVADTPELRAAYAAALPKVIDFHTRRGADERLYAKYKAVAANPASAQLSASRRKALANELRDFRLSGAELQGDAKRRYAQIQDRLGELGRTFSEHVLDATDAYAYYASEAELAGVPDDIKRVAREGALADGRDGYKLTLQMPCYQPVMQYAGDRALRERLYTAYVTRASELGAAALDNSAVIRELLELRREEAVLLGYADPAELSLVPKMADTPAQVIEFLRDLATRARPGAERDLAELRAFASAELGLPDLQAWDTSYASERLKETRFAFSDQEVKQYFTETKVLEGLFHIIETVFEVRIHRDSAPAWHPSVAFYRIERAAADAHDDAPVLVGHFYLDLHARPGKQSGAWMDSVRNRWRRPEGSLQTPVANIICNFAAPSVVDGQERPALLTHDHVVTLFHEFGHALQHMLTRIDDLGVSGLSGVEWDAVELPSQFMENFCWEWSVVKRLTAHVDTGEPLPRALFDRMLAAKNFHSGLQLLRQVEFALTDMLLHTEADAPQRVAQIVDAVRAEVALLKPPPFNRALHTFSHIFDGGYAAGYYSYQWAEVLSADAWSAFEEAPGGALDVPTGRRYRENVLETGGSRTTLEGFKAFRGREPRIDALLRHQGLN